MRLTLTISSATTCKRTRAQKSVTRRIGTPKSHRYQQRDSPSSSTLFVLPRPNYLIASSSIICRPITKHNVAFTPKNLPPYCKYKRRSAVQLHRSSCGHPYNLPADRAPKTLTETFVVLGSQWFWRYAVVRLNTLVVVALMARCQVRTRLWPQRTFPRPRPTYLDR